MKVQKRDVEVTSTIGGKKVAMDFDQSAIIHLMNVLTDLYSDPERAVLREYSTNARDSHIEAGVTRPIEVTLPAPLSPFLKIKDFGVGLSEGDIESIYSKYGASTKRQTNEQTGMLGLGCKSALAYCSQFTLVGVKDGRRVMVSVSRDEDGAGSMTVAENAETTEESGVEIIVPALSHNQFERKARDLFRFWEPGTVLVNGSEPERIEGLRVTDSMVIVEDNEEQDYIVMGGVPYPTEDRIVPELHYHYSLMAFVDIGSIDIPPDREAPQDTAHTRATLAQLHEDFIDNIDDAVQREISDAPTAPEAVEAMVAWQTVYNGLVVDFEWQGEEIPTAYSPPKPKDDGDGSLDLPRMVSVPRGGYKFSQASKTHRWDASYWRKTVWLYGYDVAVNWTANKKKKLLKYLEENAGVTAEQFILIEKAPDSKWIDSSTYLDWETIKAVKLPNTRRGQTGSTGRIPGSYDFIVKGDFKVGVPADDIDQKKAIFYVHGNRYQGHAYEDVLNKYYPGNTLVCLQANRIEKFVRSFPQAIEASVAVKDSYEKWIKSVQGDSLTALAIHDDYYDRNALSKYDASKIDDPDLAQAVKLAKRDLTVLLNEKRVFETVMPYGSVKLPAFTNPLDNYPLVSGHNSSDNLDHAYVYLNSAYALRKAGKLT